MFSNNYYSHQYVNRETCSIENEQLFADKTVRFLYHHLRENVPAMFKALTSKRMSALLGYLHFDCCLGKTADKLKLFESIGADWSECVLPLSAFDSPRKVFERQICYWENRPMENAPDIVVSPADSRILIGSLTQHSDIFIKNKFFDLEELLGSNSPWHTYFHNGDFAVCRLTPDKYHYNHVPVSGKVIDFYCVDGQYHSCNPAAHVAMASLCSKNRRIITVLDTDVQHGSGVGKVAMIEVVALMIGDIVQAYSEYEYYDPEQIKVGMFLRKGCPKSLFRPGSSTDVLLFEPDRIRFAEDLVANSSRNDVLSRFSHIQGRPHIETDIKVRSTIASAQLGGKRSI